MSLPENKPLFHWTRRDYEPLRFLASAVFAVVVLLGLYRIAIPKVITINDSFEKVRETSKLRYDKQSNLIFVSKAQADRLISDADFLLQDPFRIEQSIFMLSDAQALKQLKRVHKKITKKIEPHQLKYLEVPYKISLEKRPLKLSPLLPED